MLSVFVSPVPSPEGSANYVQAIAAQLDRGVDPHASALSCAGFAGPWWAGNGPSRRFDAAVVAVHPDQALLLLDEPTPAERAVWAIAYSTNSAQLHRRVGPAPPPSRPHPGTW